MEIFRVLRGANQEVIKGNFREVAEYDRPGNFAFALDNRHLSLLVCFASRIAKAQ
jgi:hypothetical protein